MGRSSSNIAKNAFAPAPASTPAVFTGSALMVGSDASYVANSDARSAGVDGGLGADGAENGLTAPTCASLAYDEK